MDAILLSDFLSFLDGNACSISDHFSSVEKRFGCAIPDLKNLNFEFYVY